MTTKATPDTAPNTSSRQSDQAPPTNPPTQAPPAGLFINLQTGEHFAVQVEHRGDGTFITRI